MEMKSEQECWYPYFKGTPEVHDGSGFYCFEVGYCQVGENAEISKKVPIQGLSPDHIAIWDSMIGHDDKPPLMLNVDCLKDGYIRIFCAMSGLHWKMNEQVGDPHGFSMSTMMLVAGWPIPPNPSQTNYALPN